MPRTTTSEDCTDIQDLAPRAGLCRLGKRGGKALYHSQRAYDVDVKHRTELLGVGIESS